MTVNAPNNIFMLLGSLKIIAFKMMKANGLESIVTLSRLEIGLNFIC